MHCLLITSPKKDASRELLGFLRAKNVLFEAIEDPLLGVQKAQERHFDVIVLDAKSQGVKVDRTIRLLKGCDPTSRIIVRAEENSRLLESRVRKEQVYYYHVDSFGLQDLELAITTALGLTNAVPFPSKEERTMSEQAKILLVDDDQDFVNINRTILESKGYQVQAANTPENAWEKITQWKPDMICLDVMMPTGTEGFHFAYKVRNNEATKDIPILMITSIHEHSDFHFSPDEDGQFLPVDDFAEKPVPREVLLHKVEALLGKKTSAAPRKAEDKGIGLKKE
jgi:CheY-like chemotaxis protein